MQTTNDAIEYVQEIILQRPIEQLLGEELDVEAAAACLQQWSDKMRGTPIREWEHIPPESQQLYKLLVYKVALALGGA